MFEVLGLTLYSISSSSFVFHLVFMVNIPGASNFDRIFDGAKTLAPPCSSCPRAVYQVARCAVVILLLFCCYKVVALLVLVVVVVVFVCVLLIK